MTSAPCPDAEQQGETSTCMPHLELSGSALDRRYPALVAPEDEHLEDLQEESGDSVLQRGFTIAPPIREQTISQGRKRRPQEI